MFVFSYSLVGFTFGRWQTEVYHCKNRLFYWKRLLYCLAWDDSKQTHFWTETVTVDFFILWSSSKSSYSSFINSNSIFINNGHNSDIKNLHLLKSIDKQTITGTCLTPLLNRFNKLSNYLYNYLSCAFILKNNSIIRYFLKNFFCLQHSCLLSRSFYDRQEAAIC